jgi:ferrous iron transport protein B
MGVGYCLALCVYQLGMLFSQGVFGFWTLVAIASCIAVLYFVFRKTPDYGRLSDEPQGANA